jgi:HEAT repeat protein
LAKKRIAVLFVALAAPALSCSHSPSDPVTSGGGADALVQELREFHAGIGPEISSDGRPIPEEVQRHRVYEQLRDLGSKVVLPALTRGLTDPDVQVRRNVALFLNVYAGGWYDPSEPRVNITACLPALIAALKDGDARVRQLSARAIGEIGPGAAAAVPSLVALLADRDEGSRNSACDGLAGIGSAATKAIPALKKALRDPSTDVRSLAQQALDQIRRR